MNLKPCSHRPVLNPCTLEGKKYQVDPYIGCEHYCYYCYALNQAETDWRKEILIHQDIERQLADELNDIEPQPIYMGWQTDPYQPCETEQAQTRKVLKLFLEKGHSASILTKSDLILRDLDLLTQMENGAASISVAFNDDRTRGLFEANTMATDKRIEALRQLKKAGVKTGALLCPVIPYITDAVQLIDNLVPYADVIWIYGLSIENPSDPSWLNLEPILNHHFADIKDQIEATVFSRDHGYWTQLREELADLKDDRGLNLNIHV